MYRWNSSRTEQGFLADALGIPQISTKLMASKYMFNSREDKQYFLIVSPWVYRVKSRTDKATFCWGPDHGRISGNEQAVKLAYTLLVGQEHF